MFVGCILFLGKALLNDGDAGRETYACRQTYASFRLWPSDSSVNWELPQELAIMWAHSVATIVTSSAPRLIAKVNGRRTWFALLPTPCLDSLIFMVTAGTTAKPKAIVRPPNTFHIPQCGQHPLSTIQRARAVSDTCSCWKYHRPIISFNA